MRELTQEEIQILHRHAKWLADEVEGKRANLYKADLREANLYKADLSGANLPEANLYGVDLRGANLIRTNLSKANLYGVDLSEANLYKADLRGAKNIVTFGPIGSRGDFTYAVRHTDCIMVKCGCFWGDFEHWQAKCRAIHKDTPHGRAYAAAADFIRAYAAAYWQD